MPNARANVYRPKSSPAIEDEKVQEAMKSIGHPRERRSDFSDLGEGMSSGDIIIDQPEVTDVQFRVGL